MSLDRLFVQHVRSVRQVELGLSPKTNIFHGANGEGKTSLLEAIHILSLGRSFRTRLFNAVVTHGEHQLTVSGKTHPVHEGVTQLGVRLSQAGLTARVNGRPSRGVSELSEILPVVCFTPETASLLVQKSVSRRAYMDWGCFQAQPNYLHYWRSYTRVLKQRNAAIRNGVPDSSITVWDGELARTASLLSKLRGQYVAQCREGLKKLAADFGFDFKLDLTFKLGWGGGDLTKELMDTLHKDRKRGFTQLGSHRDDLTIKIDGRAMGNEGSRGQIKLSAFALKLLQVQLSLEVSKTPPIFLLDDLPSEFDSEYLARAISSSEDLGVQLFLTTVSDDMSQYFSEDQLRVFHVKQGNVTLI